MKFIVVRAEVSPQRPRGLGCSPTLHGPDGTRLVGFDNAHPVSGRRGSGARKRRENDHPHRLRSVGPYHYRDAATLLADFWKEVDQVLKERGSLP